MRTDTAPVIRLQDYKPTDYLIPTVDLDFRLHPAETRVTARLKLIPRKATKSPLPLVLAGDDLNLVSLAINGEALADDKYQASPDGLTIASPPKGEFELTIETLVNPSANTKLMGLYRSGGNYCTQCEAEGFRRITYFLDRPDVLSVYTTRIEAERAEAPVLLGNGNPTEKGKVPSTSRHYAIWHDPFPKPSYLFALVAGDLAALKQPFKTASDRKVELAIYVQPGKEERATYAMDALKRSMRWDEKVFGLEYDLDVFNIVAVPDFNMGAMENKGLNVFNDKYVLASPDTATDQDYANIEAIIAHEYFHNWTGNRITCRDWFQLCLKEGLTVFRDQEFSSDERSRAVKRISDVRNLRAAQFSEDGGPLAHPVRPSAYKEINNFYTPTVYEKGAEVIRMLKTLIGPDAFKRGMDLYVERHDGTAATVEDFVACFAEASDRDLAPFFVWYEQAGTPQVVVVTQYDAQTHDFRIDFAQSTPPTPGQERKKPVVIPIDLALFDEDGDLIEAKTDDGVTSRGVFTLDRHAASLTFRNVMRRPIPSLLRGFSAPVRLDISMSDEDLAILFAHDDDAFNRWQAGQNLATRLMLRAIGGNRDEVGVERLVAAYLAFLKRDGLTDPALAAQTLMLPSDGDLVREIGENVDPDAVHGARKWLRREVGIGLVETLTSLRSRLDTSGAYDPGAVPAGRRALRNAALDLIVAGSPEIGEGLAAAQYQAADNMTDRMAAMVALSQVAGPCREAVFSSFEERYQGEPLALDKWFTIQAMIPESETLQRVVRLMEHPAFSPTNPNRVRSLVGAFASANPTQFNRADGAGYRFVAQLAAELDRRNPQVAARLLSAFKTWRMLEPKRRGLAEAALRDVSQTAGLSRDVADIVERALA